MIRQTCLLLRRGRAPVRRSARPNPARYVPETQKPHQGGQGMFQEFLLRSKNEDARLASRAAVTLDPAATTGGSSGSSLPDALLGESDVAAAGGGADPTDRSIPVKSPSGGFASRRLATEDAIQHEMSELIENDGFTSRRGYSDTEWYQEQVRDMVHQRQLEQFNGDENALQMLKQASKEPDGSLQPERVVDNEYFRSRFGFELIKSNKSRLAPISTEYSQLDMWAELPQYSRSTYFLYAISRRRNTYAVCYDYDGHKMLPVYSVGDKGLKGGDRGFKAEGGAEVGHQVMSMYLNDLMPRIREHAVKNGRPMGKTDRCEIVLRVLGFYNGRAGAVRAVSDRSDFYNVVYYEDITPVPTLGGPRMPKASKG